MRKSAVTFLVGGLFLASTGSLLAQGGITKYVRYSHEGHTSYGILDGDTIRQLDGDLFSSPRTSGHTVTLSDVAILAPCEPSKVIAVGLNYRSHLGARRAAEYPGLFAKYPTSIVGHGADIVIPPTPRTSTMKASWLSSSARGLKTFRSPAHRITYLASLQATM